MRIQQIFEFTEHHRFYCYRGFSLSTVDYRMLALIYKPIVGAFAVSLYESLCTMVSEGKTGYSPVEPLRRLILGLGLMPNEKSRQYLLEQLSLLEAIGLLQSYRFMQDEQDDYIYEFELIHPLSPDEFFQNIHFTMLLRDKLGKYAVIHIREQLYAPEPEEMTFMKEDREDLTVPFYEIFKLNAHIVDDELDQALQEIAPAREQQTAITQASAGYTYQDIIMQFPRSSSNRYFVEQLRMNTEQLAQINYVAYKYELSIDKVRRLLSEDGVFDVNGELEFDYLQKIAVQFYHQDQKHAQKRSKALAQMNKFQTDESIEPTIVDEEPEHDVDEQFYLAVPKVLADYCDIHQYNALMRNEPHIQFLKRYFPGQVPDWIQNVFERIDLHYKLAPPVINVLIHYGIGMNETGRVTKAYLDAIASNMLMKGVDSYEKAVQYVRAQTTLEQNIEKRREVAAGDGAANFAGSNKGSYGQRNRAPYRQKPTIPVVSSEQVASPQLTPEKLAELKELARLIDKQ